MFVNENMYVSNVFYFEILRIESSEFNNVKEVVITYDENDYDVEYAKQYVYQKNEIYNQVLEKINKKMAYHS